MRFFKKLFNRGKLEDGSYMLQSYWTAADSVEFNDEKTLEEYKSDTNTKIQGKGDHLYYDAENKTLCLLSGETVISSTEIENSGTSTEVIGDVTDVSVTPVGFTVEIKWTDHQDTENIEWGGTTVIKKKNSRPVDCLDGTVVVETTTRDQYKTTAYVDDDIDSNSSYYYRFFPYSTEGAIRNGKAVLVKTNIDNSIVYETPTIKGTYTYTGSEQNVELENFDEDKMVLSYGSATNAGVYTPTITLKEGYRWQDKTTTPLELTWVIEKAVVSTIPTQSGTITYTATERTPSWSNFDANKLNISGTTSATNAGEYTAIFTPTANYKWQDNTSTAKNVVWTIGRATISTLPSQSGTAEYTGSTVTPTWSGYDTSKMTISGQTSGVEAGNYIAVFTPTSNYKWSDDTTGGKEVTWVITNQSISTVPTQSGTLTYNGNLQTPTWSNYDTNKLTVSVTSQTNAGTYNATFTPKTGYKWSDGTTSGKSTSWTIDRATITAVPTVASSPTYNGSSQSPTWNNYDTSKMTIGGTYSSINAGTFTATFTPTSNYKWSDGSTSAKNVSWTMNKATQSLTLTASTTTVDVDDTITITASDNVGSLSVQTSSSSIATATVNGNIITITGVSVGSTGITVTAVSTTNYNSISKGKTITVTLPQKSWETVNSNPPTNGTTRLITYNGNLYMITVSSSGGSTSCFYMLDGNSWVSKGSLPFSVKWDVGIVVYNNKIHILGSMGSNLQDQNYYKHYAWDGSSWTSQSTLPYKFYQGAAVVYNNEIHIMGGTDESAKQSHYKWNGSTWSQVGTLPSNWSDSNAVVYNNSIRLVSGNYSASTTKQYIYDGSSWSTDTVATPELNFGRVIVYDNAIYGVGARQSYGNYPLCYKYSGNSWEQISTLPFSFSNGDVSVYNNTIHLVQGSSHIKMV